jgi:hypothetical protein
LFYLAFELHDGRALSADSEEKHEPASDIDIAKGNSLKALDLETPIREADIGTRTKETVACVTKDRILVQLECMSACQPNQELAQDEAEDKYGQYCAARDDQARQKPNVTMGIFSFMVLSEKAGLVHFHSPYFTGWRDRSPNLGSIKFIQRASS